MKPVRIQRKRSKGWKMPDNAVYVGRPSKWGNPFIVNERSRVTNREIAVTAFRNQLKKEGIWTPIPPSQWPRKGGRLTHIPAVWTTVEDVRRELKGKNLACWCPLTYPDGSHCPCHADVLLEIANSD